MAQPTHSEVQAVDPVLTNMLVGYKQAEERFVASRVFPVVPIEKQSGTYYIFTKKFWFQDEMKARAPGGAYARSGYGLETTTCLAQLWGLEHPIADEARANNQTPMSLEQSGVKWLSQMSLIRKERQFAADFMVGATWANHDNNSATDWDDFVNGDPVNDVLTARRTVSNSTGYSPNTVVVGSIVDQALSLHPDMIDRIKYVKAAVTATVQSAIADCFKVSQYIVGEASYNSANEGQSMTAAAIIDDDALITYVSPTPGIMEASAGYTFAWAGGGGSGVISTYREDQTDSDILKTKEAWDQKAVATDLGYFFTDIV